MPTFIPSWVRLPARELHIKRALEALDERYIVRRPLRAGTCAADFFVQHASRGWLAVAVHDARYAELDPEQLFDSEPAARLERRLDDMAAVLAAPPEVPSEAAIPGLLILWRCSREEARRLAQGSAARQGLKVVARDDFISFGGTIVTESMRPTSSAHQAAILGGVFPETEIAEPCTARRFYRRNNSARIERCFLDPEQEGACKLDLDLPAREAALGSDLSVRLVNGVAGSGKTLIAIQRARVLAELFPHRRVLVLIHNAPIVADLNARLRRAARTLPRSVELRTFYGWLFKQWHRVFNHYPQTPSAPAVLIDIVQRARTSWPDLTLSNAQLIDEIDFINDNLLRDEASYLEASRTGRGFALKPNERRQVWGLQRALAHDLRRADLHLWRALPGALCGAGAHDPNLRRYHHVVVDEAQFFAPSWFELAKLCLEPGAQLFLCADPNQGFLNAGLSWKRVGIDVAGRTKRLRRSYRTTRAILEAASAALVGLPTGDAQEYLQPDLEGMEEGERPRLIYACSPQDAQDRAVNEIVRAAAPLDAVLVIYGEALAGSALYEQLCLRVGGVEKVWWFNHRDQKKEPPGGHAQGHLRMASLATATGLEASIVFLLGIEDLLARGVSAMTPSAGAQPDPRAQSNARKLYMAMTRAAHRLVVLSSTPVPAPIERLCDLER